MKKFIIMETVWMADPTRVGNSLRAFKCRDVSQSWTNAFEMPVYLFGDPPPPIGASFTIEVVTPVRDDWGVSMYALLEFKGSVQRAIQALPADNYPGLNKAFNECLAAIQRHIDAPEYATSEELRKMIDKYASTDEWGVFPKRG
jgi:hypothetical protein